MAKKNEVDVFDDSDLEEEEEGGKKKNKKMTLIIAILIVLIWIAIFCLLVKLDVGGFGSSVLKPVLKDVPILNLILPPDNDPIYLNGTTYKTLEEAVAKINQLEDEIVIYKQKQSENMDKITSLTAENERLKVYESNQLAFEKLRKKFDEEVVYSDNAPDINTYREWYEQMYPENAAELYRQVVEQLKMEQVIQDLAKYYSSVEPDSAAKVFEEMTGDLEKVAHILSCMKPAQAGAILAAMDSTLAAKLTLLIYPVQD